MVMAETVLDGMLSRDIGERVVVVPGVEEISAALRRFKWPDYVMFVLMLLVCLVIGLYFGLYRVSNSAQEYLMGGRKMRLFPVTMSLIASFVSGISILGIPTETYLYGVQYVYALTGLIIMIFIMNSFYLPVFYNLSLTSTYEYLERRFDKKVRVLGSVLFTIGLITWLPIVIYVPALAFNQVTGVNVHIITPILCLICIFYTSLGGIKAVVWTDVIQAVIMFAAMILVAVKGTLDIGGFSIVLDRNIESGRLESPNLDFSFSSRYTFWSLSIGGGIYYLQVAAINQNMLQRYLALPSLECAQNSLSTGLNAMSAVVLEDFYRFFSTKPLSEKHASILMKMTVLVFGSICVGLVYVIEELGAVLQMSMSIGSMASGPSLGMFTMGILLPWVNSKGALMGGLSSLSFMAWLCLKAQASIASGDLSFPEKPLTTEGCHYHFVPPTFRGNRSSSNHPEEQFIFHHVSYLWYTLLGALMSIIIGLLTSFLTKSQDPRDVDPALLAPCLSRWIKPREFPNEPADGIIYAYQKNDDTNNLGLHAISQPE